MATKEMKFEEKIKELEKIINELESGNADLEDSIEKYTKAMKLVKECDEQLKNVEDAIAKIVLENGETENLEVEK
ncbi:MAG TPA: exodeoxyribonuclease VII small subunit [Mollicutes bacterium]|mgnify:CR=1 FL=1|jgi:exodeoxyribonuclease VII small subunit|nr:exodeoxyribonuclease VII small subunit [Mollicutes bacterium]